MANINKIKLSGTTYNIQDLNATKTVELTQAEYDDLSPKDPNVFYIITDAQGADLSNYYTKSETDGLLDTKLDVTAYTPTDLSNYYTKSETSGATEISTALASKADTATTYTKTETDNAITAATSTKQDTLVSGTNIKTINNQSILGEGNITIQGGSGGGKAVSAGNNISITTGETADTINCTLPISADGSSIMIKYASNSMSYDNNYSQVFGSGNTIYGCGGYNQLCITVEGIGNSCCTQATHVEGGYNTHIYGSYSHVEGAHNELKISTSPYVEVCSHVEGKYNKVLNYSEHASGQYNISVSASTTFGDSGNTLFSVGNSNDNNKRHNAFEIRQNGDIYIADTNDTSTTNYYEKPMIKLQDALGGGGGSSYTAGDGIDITNDVISVTGKVDTSAITTSITSASTDSQVPSAKAVNDQLGGLKLVKLTQSEYDALATKDNSTLYVIVN